jgi:hypothetical protein
MSDDALASAVEALDIAVFEQRPDGGFTSIGSVPAWFRTFGRSSTFPFLGSFLEEARTFWSEPRQTPLRWGPCTEVDANGQQLQFMVSAVSFPSHKFLIFELNRGGDEIQATLQLARQRALDHEAAIKELRAFATAIIELASQAGEAMIRSDREHLLRRIASMGAALIERVDRMREAK